MVMLVWSRRAVRRSSHTQRTVGSWNSQWKPNFSQNSRPENSHATHAAMPLHPRNTCFSLATVYTHAMLVLHWPQLTPTHFFMCQVLCPHICFFPVVTLLILSTTGCISQIHPSGLLTVKAIYHTINSNLIYRQFLFINAN